jgi:hypothetical protein
VTRRMQSVSSDASALGKSMPTAEDVSRVERSTELVGEYMSGVKPIGTSSEVFFELSTPMFCARPVASPQPEGSTFAGRGAKGGYRRVSGLVTFVARAPGGLTTPTACSCPSTGAAILGVTPPTLSATRTGPTAFWGKQSRSWGRSSPNPSDWCP